MIKLALFPPAVGVGVLTIESAQRKLVGSSHVEIGYQLVLIKEATDWNHRCSRPQCHKAAFPMKDFRTEMCREEAH